MGLGGRKVKQRIPNDPRNLSWADDANKFGAAYLAKLGWSSGEGLGVSGEGRATHIKVHQKLDMLGIGAAHQRDPNGLAWKQNRDFENLLRRLNESNGEDAEQPATKVDGFAKASQEIGITTSETVEAEEGEITKKKRKRDGEVVEGKKKKRRNSGGEEGEAEVREGEEKVKEKKEKKDKKKSKTKAEDVSESEEKEHEAKVAPSSKETSTPSSATQKPVFGGRPVRAHRARFLASKRMVTTSSAAVDEILGISRSGTSTPHPGTTLAAPSPSCTPISLSGGADVQLQELTISSKSVMDYFKEKMSAKSNANSGWSTAVASTSATPSRETEEDDYDDRPRGGFGLGFARGGIGSSSRLRSEVLASEEAEDVQTRQAGLGSFSRGSTIIHLGFTSGTANSSETVVQEANVDVELDIAEATSQEVTKDKEEKQEKQEGGISEEIKRYDGEDRKKKKRKGGKESEVGDEQRTRSKKDKKGKRKESEAEVKDTTATTNLPEVVREKSKDKEHKAKAKEAISTQHGSEISTKAKKSKKGRRAEEGRKDVV